MTTIVGSYGPEWTQGVLAEHCHSAHVHRLASGNRVVILDNLTYPILCGEIVEIPTEDGLIDGRCGARVEGDNFACPSHQAQIDASRWIQISS
jgi:hypothetical protein